MMTDEQVIALKDEVMTLGYAGSLWVAAEDLVSARADLAAITAENATLRAALEIADEGLNYLHLYDDEAGWVPSARESAVMDSKIDEALAYLRKVPFPEMELGAGGTIWTKASPDRPAVKVATLNLRMDGPTVLEAVAYGTAFIAAGEALDRAYRATQEQQP